MENTSKALLIAAGVLVAIIIIAFGIKIFNSTFSAGIVAKDTGETINDKTGEATGMAIGEIAGQKSASGTTGSGATYIDEAPEQIMEKPWVDNNNGRYTRDGVTVKIGDYVNYNHQKDAKGMNINLQYTSPKDKTKYYKDGKYNDQVFSTNSTIEGWRVLGINNNGQLELMATNSVGTKDNERFGLNYEEGYINGVSELNKACAIFGKGKGAASARSINLNDFNQLTGVKTIEDICRVYGSSDYGKKVQYRFPTEEEKIGNTRHMQYRTLEFGQTQWSDWKNVRYSWVKYFVLPDGSKRIDKDNPGTVEETFTEYWISLWNNLYLKGKQNVYEILNTHGIEDNYWVADSYVEARDWAEYGLFKNSGGLVSDQRLGGSCSGVQSNGLYKVKPIVELSNNVELEWNNNTNKFDIK